MPEAALAEWSVSRRDFPQGGTVAQQLRFLLNYAILAPSSHNTQPWRFRIAGDVLELHADRSRALAVVDPYDRALIMSCGAALFNLRVALRFFGYAGAVQYVPTTAASDLLVRVRPGAAAAKSPQWDALFDAIPRRVTNRQRFAEARVPPDAQEALRAAARAEGASLDCIEETHDRNRVAKLIAAGDREQYANPSFRRELAAWVHAARIRDGIPGYALGATKLLDFATPVVALVLRTFDVGSGVAARDADLVKGSPLLAALATTEDDERAWLAAGQALERVLLTACAAGFDASFLNQPIEVPALRSSLREAIGGHGFPQILLRIGKGPAQQHTPRRPVAEVLSD